jgi:hypothetical protein
MTKICLNGWWQAASPSQGARAQQRMPMCRLGRVRNRAWRRCCLSSSCLPTTCRRHGQLPQHPSNCLPLSLLSPCRLSFRLSCLTRLLSLRQALSPPPLTISLQPWDDVPAAQSAPSDDPFADLDWMQETPAAAQTDQPAEPTFQTSWLSEALLPQQDSSAQATPTFQTSWLSEALLPEQDSAAQAAAPTFQTDWLSADSVDDSAQTGDANFPNRLAEGN